MSSVGSTPMLLMPPSPRVVPSFKRVLGQLLADPLRAEPIRRWRLRALGAPQQQTGRHRYRDPLDRRQVVVSSKGRLGHGRDAGDALERTLAHDLPP